jgi:UDP-N-acetylglucosamine 4,6-dehydratase
MDGLLSGEVLRVAGAIDGRTVLITGGTGSFGQTMARHLLSRGAGQIRILSRDEAKQDAMRHKIEDPRLRFYLGDVRDLASVERATRDVDFVFHAAALKQVPSCEFFPIEAVRTNVLGSSNVVDACERNGVSSLVCLSTDKAVYPVNAMGISKAMMEKVAAAHARNNPSAVTTVSCVRYGNVMYSRGSVIPLFIDQIRNRRPITITAPGMTRFMMSLAESVDLVEFAFGNARPGDLFVRKAPACTIGDLVKALGQLFGVPVEERVIGVRHGEKLYETLVSREEMANAEDHGAYYQVPIDTRDLNYSLFFEQGSRDELEFDDYTSANTDQLDVDGVVALLQTLPEIGREVGSLS